MMSHTSEAPQPTRHIKSTKNWQRLAFMALFALLLHLASAVMWVLCALQFIFALTTGQDNDNLRTLGDSIAQYIHQTLRYLSYNSEQKPFPFSDWPTPMAQPHTAPDEQPEEEESPKSQNLPEH